MEIEVETPFVTMSHLLLAATGVILSLKSHERRGRGAPLARQAKDMSLPSTTRTSN